MEETLPQDAPEKQQQRHGGAGGSPTYFGSGNDGGSEDHNTDLKRFFVLVDAALAPLFNEQSAPVVLAGVEYLLPIYRTANTCATILEGEIHGNQDRATAEELHEAGWRIVAPHFTEAESKAKDIFHQLLGKGTASADASVIGTAADTGRIATLFVAPDPDRSPFVNRMVAATLAKGGEVFAMEQEAMPTTQPLAATFRF
jgi:hypothetical protein